MITESLWDIKSIFFLQLIPNKNKKNLTTLLCVFLTLESVHALKSGQTRLKWQFALLQSWAEIIKCTAASHLYSLHHRWMRFYHISQILWRFVWDWIISSVVDSLIAQATVTDGRLAPGWELDDFLKKGWRIMRVPAYLSHYCLFDQSQIKPLESINCPPSLFKCESLRTKSLP